MSSPFFTPNTKPMNPMKEIRLNPPLALWRLALGITQETLAKRLGVTRETVSNWERGDVPTVAVLAMETIERTLASPEKTRAEESGKI
jgi:DNA-binding XRE family transcriptional regulator